MTKANRQCRVTEDSTVEHGIAPKDMSAKPSAMSAGLRGTYWNADRATWVSVYDGTDCGMDIDAGRWQVVCERHGSILSVNTLKLAHEDARRDPADFCEDCRDDDEGSYPDGDPCDCGTVFGERGFYLPHAIGAHPDCTGTDDDEDDGAPFDSSHEYASDGRATEDDEDAVTVGDSYIVAAHHVAIVASFARDFASDCEWSDVDADDIAAMTDAAVIRCAARRYDGGIRALVSDAMADADAPTRAVELGTVSDRIRAARQRRETDAVLADIREHAASDRETLRAIGVDVDADDAAVARCAGACAIADAAGIEDTTVDGVPLTAFQRATAAKLVEHASADAMAPAYVKLARYGSARVDGAPLVLAIVTVDSPAPNRAVAIWRDGNAHACERAGDFEAWMSTLGTRVAVQREDDAAYVLAAGGYFVPLARARELLTA